LVITVPNFHKIDSARFAFAIDADAELQDVVLVKIVDAVAVRLRDVNKKILHGRIVHWNKLAFVICGRDPKKPESLCRVPSMQNADLPLIFRRRHKSSQCRLIAVRDRDGGFLLLENSRIDRRASDVHQTERVRSFLESIRDVWQSQRSVVTAEADRFA
jgi:hypothetical protein